MHAHATSPSASHHVSRVEDIVPIYAPKKSRSKSLYPDTDRPAQHTPSRPFLNASTIAQQKRRASTIVPPTASLSRSSSHNINNVIKCNVSSPTATETNTCSTDLSRDSLNSASKNSNGLRVTGSGNKCFSKANTTSRNSVTSKGKGVCCVRRRLLDEEGFIRRAACICVNKDETQVLLVSSKKDPCVWLVPGGGLEAGEEAVAAAHREAWEEAGIQGVIERFLGLFETYHHSGTKKHRTAAFVFVVTKEHVDFPEARLGRRRRWFSMEDALLMLARHRPLQSAYLQLLMMSKLKMKAAAS